MAGAAVNIINAAIAAATAIIDLIRLKIYLLLIKAGGSVPQLSIVALRTTAHDGFVKISEKTLIKSLGKA
jgi:hypothetical protein